MSDGVIINVVTPATSHDLIDLATLKTMLDVASTDTSHDAQYQLLITQNSQMLAQECNRGAIENATFAKETVEEAWKCVGPVCCPNGANKIWLSHYPIETITSIEQPAGTVLDPSAYVYEPLTGKVYILAGGNTDIVINYTGGYDLPTEAPPPLQQITGLLVKQYRAALTWITGSGSGVRLLAHKESRVVYFSPKDLIMAGFMPAGGPAAALVQYRDILTKYTRFAM
jgi:hypothetical protein